eukprot:COSAG01_NODE_4245_length_5210_cov_1.702074_1_plen_62_part_00
MLATAAARVGATYCSLHTLRPTAHLWHLRLPDIEQGPAAGGPMRCAAGGGPRPRQINRWNR